MAVVHSGHVTIPAVTSVLAGRCFVQKVGSSPMFVEFMMSTYCHELIVSHLFQFSVCSCSRGTATIVESSPAVTRDKVHQGIRSLPVALTDH